MSLDSKSSIIIKPSHVPSINFKPLLRFTIVIVYISLSNFIVSGSDSPSVIGIIWYVDAEHASKRDEGRGNTFINSDATLFKVKELWLYGEFITVGEPQPIFFILFFVFIFFCF